MVSCCPYCKKESQLFFETKDYNRKITEEVFNYYRCKSCGLIFLFPIPDDLGKYYPSDYYVIPSSLEQSACWAENERYKLEIVQRFISSGRLLEIGPSWGSFVYLAKRAGFEAEAIEMDSRCCKFLIDVVNVLAIKSDDVIEALQKTKPYNVIAMWHVIEHLPDPWTTLEDIVKRILPGGILVIAAPNPKAFQFGILKRFWTHIDAPRHLELIPTKLLSEYMQAHGLRKVLDTTTDKGSLGWNKFGWTQSLVNRLDNRFAKFCLRLIAKVICITFAIIERREGYGSTYTLVFQKEQ